MEQNGNRFNKVVVAGTFDHLHQGHLNLLSRALELTSEKLFIGVFNGDLSHKLYADRFQSISTRIQNVTDYIISINSNKIDFHVFELFDSIGLAGIMPDLDAIVASKETEEGCAKVNEFRAARGLKEIHSVIVDLVQFQGEKMSSTYYRSLEP